MNKELFDNCKDMVSLSKELQLRMLEFFLKTSIPKMLQKSNDNGM